MALCNAKVTSHYLNQCWQCAMMTHGIPGHKQWVDTLRPEWNGNHFVDRFIEFSWCKSVAFWLVFHWIVFLGPQLTNQPTLGKFILIFLTSLSKWFWQLKWSHYYHWQWSSRGAADGIQRFFHVMPECWTGDKVFITCTNDDYDLLWFLASSGHHELSCSLTDVEMNMCAHLFVLKCQSLEIMWQIMNMVFKFKFKSIIGITSRATT